LFVAGVDGFRGGWIAFRVDLMADHTTSVDVVDLSVLLRERPPGLVCVGIDIPVGLFDGARNCDRAARKLLGQPRGTSVFAPPCRRALSSNDHTSATVTNLRMTGRGLSRQAWGIAPKIKQVDDAITPDCQRWAFEVHPEVCFWALNQRCPMKHNKKTKKGSEERSALLRGVFPKIETHLANRLPRVGADDLLDAAAAAWTALRWHRNEAECVCSPERDEKGLAVTIYY